MIKNCLKKSDKIKMEAGKAQVIMILSLFILLLAGCDGKDYSEESYADALTLYEQRDYISAYENLSNEELTDYSPALVLMGRCYMDGTGVPQDYQQAISCFEDAADKGDAEAMYYLGVMYANGWGVEADSDTSIRWYKKSAEGGCAEGQTALGILYHYGTDDGIIVADYETAEEWYVKAVSQENMQAYVNLSILLMTDEYEGADYIRAFEYLTEASEKYDDSCVQYTMATLYANSNFEGFNYETAVEWLEKAAAHYDDYAAYAWNGLASFYYNGYGVEKNEVIADEWFAKISERNQWAEQMAYAEQYFKGSDGVDQDYENAFGWYMTCAEGNQAEAQFYVGLCYQYGLGTDKNQEEAARWYYRSAALGFDDAKEQLEIPEIEKALENLSFDES